MKIYLPEGQDAPVIGQLWADMDKRNPTPRTLRIDGFAVKHGELCAGCTVIETKKKVMVLVRRLKPGSAGYRLVPPQPKTGNFPKGD